MRVGGHYHDRSFYSREWAGTHSIGGWVDLWAGLEGCGKSRPHRFRSPDRPARSESLYRPRYPGPYMYILLDINIRQFTLDKCTRYCLQTEDVLWSFHLSLILCLNILLQNLWKQWNVVTLKNTWICKKYGGLNRDNDERVTDFSKVVRAFRTLFFDCLNTNVMELRSFETSVTVYQGTRYAKSRSTLMFISTALRTSDFTEIMFLSQNESKNSNRPQGIKIIRSMCPIKWA
jgi:hypothetical protein